MKIPKAAPRIESGERFQAFAACAGANPAVFIVESYDKRAAAAKTAHARQKYCDRCPVIAQCLAFAFETNDTFSILGGTSPDERRTMRTKGLHRGLV